MAETLSPRALGRVAGQASRFQGARLMTQIMTREEREALAEKRRQAAIARCTAHENCQPASAVRMHVSPWFRDELGNPSRVVRCAE